MNEHEEVIPFDPFKRKTDNLAIVGFSMNSRSLAPYDNPDFEVWGLNEEYIFPWMKRWDRWFQLHPKWDYIRNTNMNDPNHPLWLQNISGTCMKCAGEGEYMDPVRKEILKCGYCVNGKYTPPETRAATPIYLQKADPDIPHSYAYPLKEVTKLTGLRIGKPEPYFTSSPSFMLAMGLWMGFKRIECYGFEMAMDTEYHYQRPNFEYLLGVARGMGVKIDLPNSKICTGRLYGYDNMKTGFRQDVEMRLKFLDERIKETSRETQISLGRKRMLEELKFDPSKPLEEQLERLRAEAEAQYRQNLALENFKKGAAQEVGHLTKVFDIYFRPENLNEKVPQGEVLSLITTDYTME